MRIRLLAALLIGAAFLSSAAAPAPAPTLCRVQASYRPVSWPFWTPPDKRFRQITVELRPGCPRSGQARIRFVNAASGRRLPEFGVIVLTPDRPRYQLPNLSPLSGVMPTFKVLWVAASGEEYTVQQRLFPGDAP